MRNCVIGNNIQTGDINIWTFLSQLVSVTAYLKFELYSITAKSKKGNSFSSLVCLYVPQPHRITERILINKIAIGFYNDPSDIILSKVFT